MATPEQIAAAKASYDGAMTAQQAAKAIVDSIKASSAATVTAYEQAKAAYDALKPSAALAKAKLQRAEADVTIARAEYQLVAPKEVAADTASRKGTGNKELLAAVTAFLATKPDGASNQEIFDALLSGGVEMAGDKARENLNSYLSRWASAGSLVNKGTGAWGVAIQAPITPPSFLGTPAAVAPEPVVTIETPAPSFLAPVASDALGDEFPGVEALTEAGITTKASLVGKTAEDLVAIPGIGAKTAGKILAALVG